jgi:hypothetical protein
MIKVKKSHCPCGFVFVYVNPEVALFVSAFAEFLVQSDTLLVVACPHSSFLPGVEYFPYFSNQSALVTKSEYLNHILTVAGFESVPENQCSRQFWQNNVTPMAWQAALMAPATGHLVQIRPKNQTVEEHVFKDSFAIQCCGCRCTFKKRRTVLTA